MLTRRALNDGGMFPEREKSDSDRRECGERERVIEESAERERERERERVIEPGLNVAAELALAVRGRHVADLCELTCSQLGERETQHRGGRGAKGTAAQQRQKRTSLPPSLPPSLQGGRVRDRARGGWEGGEGCGRGTWVEVRNVEDVRDPGLLAEVFLRRTRPLNPAIACPWDE